MKYIFCCGDDWKSRETLQGIRLENGFVYEVGYKIMQLNAQSQDNTLFIARTGEIVYIPNIYDESELALFFRTFEDLMKHEVKAKQIYYDAKPILELFSAEAVIMFYNRYIEQCREVSKKTVKNYLLQLDGYIFQQIDKDDEIQIFKEDHSLMDAWETTPIMNFEIDRHLEPANISNLYISVHNPDSEKYAHTYFDVKYKNLSGEYRYNLKKVSDERMQKIHEFIRYI
jgi:hypothetical protein